MEVVTCQFIGGVADGSTLSFNDRPPEKYMWPTKKKDYLSMPLPRTGPTFQDIKSEMVEYRLIPNRLVYVLPESPEWKRHLAKCHQFTKSAFKKIGHKFAKDIAVERGITNGE